jgi:hypothetical protein
MFTNAHTTRRFTRSLAAAAAVVAIGAPAAQAGEFIPGVTDFPSRVAYVEPEKFVPGVTDFPNRLGEKAEQAARARLARADAAPASSGSGGDSSVDWAAAGIGATLGAAGMLLAALAYRVRPRLRPAGRSLMFMSAAALASGAALATGAAGASGATGAGAITCSGPARSCMTAAAFRALRIRSEALNHKYGLGTELRALRIRSEALNHKYGLDR